MSVTQTPISITQRSIEAVNQMSTNLKLACQSKDNFKAYVRTKDSETSGKWSWVNEGEHPSARGTVRSATIDYPP